MSSQRRQATCLFSLDWTGHFRYHQHHYTGETASPLIMGSQQQDFVFRLQIATCYHGQRVRHCIADTRFFTFEEAYLFFLLSQIDLGGQKGLNLRGRGVNENGLGQRRRTSIIITFPQIPRGRSGCRWTKDPPLIVEEPSASLLCIFPSHSIKDRTGWMRKESRRTAVQANPLFLLFYGRQLHSVASRQPKGQGP